MLRDNPNRAHRDTFHAVRRYVTDAKDKTEMDLAYSAFVNAQTDFSTFNSDHTMINLIGTWARLQRVIWSMDDKYGRRE